jgi:hypothetical protein
MVPVAGVWEHLVRRETMMPRMTFIDAYVDLRVAALRSEGDQMLTDSARARSSSHDAWSERKTQLLGFVDRARGRELDFMRDLWNEIEMRMDSVPPIPADSLS